MVGPSTVLRMTTLRRASTGSAWQSFDRLSVTGVELSPDAKSAAVELSVARDDARVSSAHTIII